MVYPRVTHVSHQQGGGLVVRASAFSDKANVSEVYVGVFTAGVLQNADKGQLESFMQTLPNLAANGNEAIRYDQKVFELTGVTERFNSLESPADKTAIAASDECGVCVFAKDDSGLTALDLAAVNEAPTVVSSSFVDLTAKGRYIQPETVSGEIHGQSAGVNTIQASFDYNHPGTGSNNYVYAFATATPLTVNPLSVLVDPDLASAVVSQLVEVSGTTTITVSSMITSDNKIEQIPDTSAYVYVVGADQATAGDIVAKSNARYDFQSGQAFPVSRLVKDSLTNVAQNAETNEWTLDASVDYIAGAKASGYGPTQGLRVYGVFDTHAAAFDMSGLGGVSWETGKAPAWANGDYKVQGPGTAFVKSDGSANTFATLQGNGLTNALKYSADWTYTCWVKHDAPAASGANDSPNFGGLSATQSDLVYVRVQRDPTSGGFKVFAPDLVSSTTVSAADASVWTHIGITWAADSKTIEYFINGTSAASYTAAGTRTRFANISPAIAEAVVGNDTAVYFDDLRIYNRVLTLEDFGALNDIKNYFHTFGTVLEPADKAALIESAKTVAASAELSSTGYTVDTTFTEQPMTHVLDKNNVLFPATAVNYVHAHALASGATQDPALFDANKVGVASALVDPMNVPNYTGIYDLVEPIQTESDLVGVSVSASTIHQSQSPWKIFVPGSEMWMSASYSSSPRDSDWVEITFDSPTYVAVVRTTVYKSSPPDTIRFEYSENGTDFVPVPGVFGSFQNYTNHAVDTVETYLHAYFTFGNEGLKNTRSLRMYVTKPTNNDNIRLYNLNVYGNRVSDVPVPSDLLVNPITSESELINNGITSVYSPSETPTQPSWNLFNFGSLWYVSMVDDSETWVDISFETPTAISLIRLVSRHTYPQTMRFEYSTTDNNIDLIPVPGNFGAIQNFEDYSKIYDTDPEITISFGDEILKNVRKLRMYFTKKTTESIVRFAFFRLFGKSNTTIRDQDPLPHVDIPSSYWSRFYNQARAEGTAFSSLADIDTIYPPVAFASTVDLSDSEKLKTFFEQGLSATGEIAQRYAVGAPGELAIEAAYPALTGGYGMESGYASGVSLVMALDPSTTDFLDVSGIGNHATVVNNTNGGLTSGEDADGKYLEFDGVTSATDDTYIQLDHTLFRNATSGANEPFTFDITFKVNEGYTYQDRDYFYLGFGGNDGRLYCISDGVYNTTQFGAGDAGYKANIQQGVIYRHTWVYDGANGVSLYIDGSLVPVYSSTNKFDGMTIFSLNGEPSGVEGNNGRIPMKVYGVYVFQSALDATQLEALWGQTSKVAGQTVALELTPSIPLEEAGNYQVVMAAKDSTGNVGFGEVPMRTVNPFDASVYKSTNSGLSSTTITDAIFDREAQTNARYQLGKVVLDNGDFFYGPRQDRSGTSDVNISPAFFIDNNFGTTNRMRPSLFVGWELNPHSNHWEFYYEPTQTTDINKCTIYVDLTRDNLIHHVYDISLFDGSVLQKVSNPSETLPYQIPEGAYTTEDNGITISFDTVKAGPGNPIKLTLSQNNDTFYMSEIQFGYDGPASFPTFAPLSTLKTSISSAQFVDKSLQLSGEVTASSVGATVYKTLATTEPGLTPDQVLAKIESAPAAGALVTGDTGMAAEVVIDGTTYPVTLDTVTDASDDKTPWVLVMNYVHQKGIDSGDDLKVLSDKLPIQNTTFKEFIDNSSVPTEYNSASWGHTGQELFDKICVALGSVSQSDGLDAGVELMFRMYSNQSASKIHFKTHKASLIENYRGNPNISASTLPSGTFWATSEYTVFDNAYGVYDSTAHNSPYNPAKTDYFNYRTNDYAMTNYPFYPTASYDSSYRYVVCNSGSGESSATHQWLVDNNYGSEPSNNRTIHQIWVRANKAPGASLSDLTIPKVLDITGGVYDSSAVNYANVYLYGSDGVNAKHDALALKEIDPNQGAPSR